MNKFMKLGAVVTAAVAVLSPVAAFAQITVPDWSATTTNSLLATAGDTLGENFPALIEFFIKFGLPILLIIAVWFFVRRLMRGRA
jgi:hypothetical protein